MIDSAAYLTVEIVRFRVTCQRCGVQSRPLRPEAVVKWKRAHDRHPSHIDATRGRTA